MREGAQIGVLRDLSLKTVVQLPTLLYHLGQEEFQGIIKPAMEAADAEAVGEWGGRGGGGGKQHSTPVLPGQESADPMLKALCNVSSFQQGQVPMFPQLEYSETTDLPPPPSTLPPPSSSTSGAHQKSQCSQLRKRSSSWKLRKGGGREESRKQLSKHASDFPKWKQGEGKGWVWKKSGFFLGPLHGYECQLLSGHISHLCLSSQMVAPPAPER